MMKSIKVKDHQYLVFNWSTFLEKQNYEILKALNLIVNFRNFPISYEI